MVAGRRLTDPLILQVNALCPSNAFNTPYKGELTVLEAARFYDDYHRTFAVSTLEPSLEMGVLPQYRTLIFPL